MVVYLDYSVSSGPFFRFSLKFELLSEILYHSVCEIRDPSLIIARHLITSVSKSCLWMGGGWVYLDYNVSSGPFLSFSLSLSPFKL